MVGELSKDGKWIWDGSDWKPVQAEGDTKPLSAPSTNNKKIRPITIIAYSFSSLMLVLFITSGFVDGWDGCYGTVDAAAIESGELDFDGPPCSDTSLLYDLSSSLTIPLFILTLICLTIKWKSDPVRIEKSKSIIANKADIEFASGNIAGALKLYKKIGVLEKVKTCAEMLESHNSSAQETTPLAQNTQSLGSNLVLPSVQDSVVTGDIHYHINTAPNVAESNIQESNNVSNQKRSDESITEKIIRAVFSGIGEGIIVGIIPFVIVALF